MRTKITKNLIKQIEAEAKKYFENSSGCHDWTHVERVRNLALKIGKKEKVDLGILEMAALLHDICKSDELKCQGKFCHAERGAALAQRILKKHGIDEDAIKRVAHCIIAHRYRNNYRPETIEAKVLSDADKLDAIGAVGIARDFVAAGFIGTPVLYTGTEKKLAKSNEKHSYSDVDTAILEYEVKLKHLKSIMFTREGRRIGKERHKFMEKFFARFWEEARGRR
jgi:uncharacterized protein